MLWQLFHLLQNMGESSVKLVGNSSVVFLKCPINVGKLCEHIGTSMALVTSDYSK